ncbi:MAG: PDZ domain-containing protein [Saprospiraceae bacterium]|nr:PDZ domain-containing protein [Saprospiraceae bacterium]
MKTIAHLLAIFFILMPWCRSPLFSQQNTANSEKVITITKRSVDKDGSETTETIVKKGKASENFDVDKYISENRADNVQVEVRVEQRSNEESTVTMKRSPSKAKSQSTHPEDGYAGIYGAKSNEPKPFLGVEEDSDEDPNEPGLVVDVVRGSAADLAGLRDNDVIMSLNGAPITRWSDLSNFMKTAKTGDKVKIVYRRNGKEATTEATLITRSEVKKETPAPRGFLGVSPKGTDDKAPGTIVSITKSSAAEKAGLQTGDVIFQLDDTTIADYEDISDFMRYTKPGDKVRIVFERNGQRNTTEATLGEQKAWDWENWNIGNLNLDNLKIDIRDKAACLGVYSVNATVDDQQGTQITGFTEKSAARESNMITGDLITSINGQRVRGHDDLWNEIAKLKVGDKVVVGYLRDKQLATVETTLKACRDQSRVEMSETDEDGNSQNRRFFTWNWDQDEQQRLRTNRIITIRKPTDGDATNAELAPEQPTSQDRILTLDSFRAYPNPTQGQVTISFKAAPIATVVTLYDMNGRQLFREELNYFSGDYHQQFDLSDYAKGTVVVRVQQSEKVFTNQIVVN